MKEITKRQREILYLISEGCTTKEVANELHLSAHTVKTHREHIIQKCNAKNIVHAVKMCIKAGIIVLFPLLLFGQPDTLCLTGRLTGTYTAKEFIKVDSATSYVLPVTLQIGSCDTMDTKIPGVAVLRDSCIRDEEWFGITGYDQVLTDSAAFFSEEAMTFFTEVIGNFAVDDCGVDSFFVKSLIIEPPGGVDRPGESKRTFRVTFRVVDHVGRASETTMLWIRVPDSEGCI